MTTQTIDTVTERLRNEINVIGMEVLTGGYTLADAIREGSTVTEQKVGGWGDGKNACALTAAYIAAKARHLV